MQSTISFDLPGATIELYKEFFSTDYYRSLEGGIEWTEKEIVLFGKRMLQPRLVAFYGDEGVRYRYSGQTMRALAWTPELIDIKTQIRGLTGHEFNSCLLNLYRDGNDSMGWHQDNEKELGQNPTIASVSFGGARMFKLKHINQKNLNQDILLENKDLLIMKDETQHNYKHAILKSKTYCEPRINLTFRNIL